MRLPGERLETLGSEFPDGPFGDDGGERENSFWLNFEMHFGSGPA